MAEGDEMGVGYADVKAFHESSMSRYEHVRDLLLKEIHGAHREIAGDKPLYAVNDRIKELDSLYLKCKRKNIQDKAALDRLEDNVGIRMLCLFEQQIYPAHQMLLQIINRDERLMLRELTLFNWDYATKETILQEGRQCIGEPAFVPWPKEKKASARFETKGSGYKSLHYIIYVEYPGGCWTAVEVQLRTLIQDLWGQIEHTVSYKRNNIAPYIRKNFHLLASQLGGVENTVGWLKESADKDHMVHSYFQEQYRPLRSMKYETAILPRFFCGACDVERYRNQWSVVKNRYQAYVTYVEAYRRDSVSDWEKWLGEAWTKICELHTVVTTLLDATQKTMQSDVALLYWFQMEAAFLLFCGPVPDVDGLSDWKDEKFAGLSMAPWFSTSDAHQNGSVLSANRSAGHALKIYTDLLDNLPFVDEGGVLPASDGERVRDFLSDRYVIHFRMGEILHSQGKVDRALVHFDWCEAIMDGASETVDAGMTTHSRVNRLSIHIKLAHIYWSLGAEYYPLALVRIDTAKKLYLAHKTELEGEMVSGESVSLQDMIENNVLWYHTEQLAVLIAQSKPDKDLIQQHMHIVNEAMRSLTALLSELQKLPNHFLDTVAWYYYQRFRSGKTFGGSVADLDKAKFYADRMWNQRASTINPSAIYLMEALEGRKNRLQEILHAHPSEFRA